MEVIVLAGGMGTRLRELVKDVPKPMAPIKGKPFLVYLINWIIQFPVKKIVFAVGYKADVIKDYFGNSFHNIPIVYAEEKEPLGTGGAITNALKYISSAQVTIINGDTYFPINLELFNAFHQKSGSQLSIALKEMTDFERYGSVELAGEVITGFKEKQPIQKGFINGGIYILNTAFLQNMNLPLQFSFEQTVFEKEVLSGELKAMAFNDTFIDIGVPVDYKKACAEL
jgi:D-glycero-alpha-D-manno-heptose 1-phosphate guanylyltransferase